MIVTSRGTCEDAREPLLSAKHPVDIHKVGVIVTTSLLPGPLSGCASPTGLAETVHCDLQPVDSEVTYVTSQVSEGCVAHDPNATLEVHIFFLEFPTVSA